MGAFQGLLCYPSLQKSSVAELLVLLYHPYPKVRKEAAEKLYLTLISAEETSKGLFKDKTSMEETLAILSGTEWTDKLRVIGKTREIVYKNLSMPAPTEPMEKLIAKEEAKRAVVHRENALGDRGINDT